jgi:hypothetical protein
MARKQVIRTDLPISGNIQQYTALGPFYDTKKKLKYVAKNQGNNRD